MANLEITNVCSMQCSYCFARDSLNSNHLNKEKHIPISSFNRHLNFLDRSSIDQVRLIGGEPTLHPEFDQLIKIAHQKGKHILVFSNGLMPSAALESILRLQVSDCTVLINMTASHHGSNLSAAETNQRNENIKQLGQRAIPGFNIHKPDFNLNPVFSLIKELGCRKSLRLGIAHPSLSGSNQFLHPKQLPFVGRKIAEAAKTAAVEGIKLEFDCGFVRCMFSADEFNTLIEADVNFGWRCNPVLDISLAGEIIHCFPLASRDRLQLSDQKDADFYRQTFTAKNQHFRETGIYPECSQCGYKETGECTGGCLASTIQRFNTILRN